MNSGEGRRFYVYVHRRKDNHCIFYVGKGTGDRLNSTLRRNVYWWRVVNKHGYYAEKFIENLTHKEALDMEQKTIREIGRKNLTNMTDGGDGQGSGYVPSRETRIKMSQAQKGRARRTPEQCKAISDRLQGHFVSDDTRRKISERRKINWSDPEYRKKASIGQRECRNNPETVEKYRKANDGFKRPVMCVETGVVYESQIEASRQTGIKQGSISIAVSGKRNYTAGGLHWVSICKES